MVNPSAVLSIQTPSFLSRFSLQSVEFGAISRYNQASANLLDSKDRIDSSGNANT